MRVSIATQPGGPQPNEDWVGATANLAIVLDGLSTGGLDTGCRHGVPWYVASLGGQLFAALATSRRSIAEGLSMAIERVAESHRECDLSNPGTPSATVSILRENDGVLDYLVLADSPIAFESSDDIRVVTDLRVDGLLPEYWAETKRHLNNTPEHAASMARLIEAQRLIRNTEEGYWIAATVPEAAHHAITGEVEVAGLRSVALMSDGASRLVDVYGAASWPEVFEALRRGGPQGLIDAVRKVEASDPHGERWPRYKSGDDIALAYCLPR